MMCDLHNALQDLESWNHGKGLILHAEPCSKNYFCSGGHLETGKNHSFCYLVYFRLVEIKIEYIPLRKSLINE
jgi:hypothetical protein